MNKYFFFGIFLFICFSCTPDGHFDDLYKNDTTLGDSAGVDTFSVKRPQALTEAEKKQLAIDKKENDSLESEVSTIINQGNPDKNLILSENRAKAVREYIVSKGIAADRISSKGLGITKPIVANDTPENRKLNRQLASDNSLLKFTRSIKRADCLQNRSQEVQNMKS